MSALETLGRELRTEGRRFSGDARVLARRKARSFVAHLHVPPIPQEYVVPLEEADEVLLVCSDTPSHFNRLVYAQESAFAHEMTARGRSFAVTHDPGRIFGKSVMWFLPFGLVTPRLWDYSRQAREFVSGLERQGNRVFCSSAETEFWENKVHMHRCLTELDVPTPPTRILTAKSWSSVDFEFEPALIKLEHASGSEGMRHFATAAEAREFVAAYTFRPSESLIMQQVVPGAIRDMRLTMVGDQPVESATYWRTKSAKALARPDWTPTATKFESLVTHELPPEDAVRHVADALRKLGIRTAGVDLMWPGDDVSEVPLILEFSPYYAPNPPMPERLGDVGYKSFKKNWAARDGYLVGQFHTCREIMGRILDQGLF